MIENFTIFGERCSGTNFLEEAIIANFNIDVTWKYCWKHFFCYNNIDDHLTDKTLFIGIVRNPIDWIASLHNKLHHIPKENHKLLNFLTNNFYSVDADGSVKQEDLNYQTGEKYKDIFQMRKTKNDFLIFEMPKKVKNFILIRYEDLKNRYNEVLKMIKTKFDLTTKSNKICRIEYYKKHKDIKFVEHEYNLHPKIKRFIMKKVDKQQEKFLRYSVG